MKHKPGPKALARTRAELIVQVQSGLLSAAQAARTLGVSRKTYYKWESRALAAMIQALEERARGRPNQAQHRQLQALHKEKEELEKKLRVQEQTLSLRQQISDLTSLAVKRGGAEKKPPKDKAHGATTRRSQN